MAIVFAFCCLGFAAVNDFIFKLFANNSESSSKQRSCGTFVTIVGLVEVACLIWLVNDVKNWQATILWGLVSGMLSVISNILLIESMRFQSAGVSSTIFRLNMVLVVLGGFFLLGEPLTPTLIGGVICAFLAILAFVPSRDGSVSPKAKLGFLMAITACVLRAGMSLSYKHGFASGADVNAVSVLNGMCWVVGGPLFSLMRERRIELPSRHDATIGVVSGLFVCGIIFFMARMNAYGNASVVNPIAQMSFLGTFLLSAIFLKEKISGRKIAAITLGCIAIVLLTPASDYLISCVAGWFGK